MFTQFTAKMLGHLSVFEEQSGYLRIKRVNGNSCSSPLPERPHNLCPVLPSSVFALDTNCPGWTLSSSTNPKCHISEASQGPFSPPSGVESSTALSQVLWGHHVLTSAPHPSHHGCLSEIHTRSSSLAPGGTYLSSSSVTAGLQGQQLRAFLSTSWTSQPVGLCPWLLVSQAFISPWMGFSPSSLSWDTMSSWPFLTILG